jgi:hypothetical protein
MDLLNFFQFLQALLAIFVVVCLCTKGPVKPHCHVALVVLVISIMFIPPFGHNFLSDASMKEGATGNATPHDASGYKHYRTGGIIDITPTEKKALLDMTLFDFVTMIQTSDKPLTPTQRKEILNGYAKKGFSPAEAQADMAEAEKNSKQAVYLQNHLKKMTVERLADLLKPPSSQPTRHQHFNPLGPDVVPYV